MSTDRFNYFWDDEDEGETRFRFQDRPVESWISRARREANDRQWFVPLTTCRVCHLNMAPAEYPRCQMCRRKSWER